MLKGLVFEPPGKPIATLIQEPVGDLPSPDVSALVFQGISTANATGSAGSCIRVLTPHAWAKACPAGDFGTDPL